MLACMVGSSLRVMLAPTGRVIASAPQEIPSLSLSPAATVYTKVSTLEYAAPTVEEYLATAVFTADVKR